MAKGTDFHLVKAPDGFYFGRILKSGMLSSDSRRITDEEVMGMFEDVLRRNKAETGRSVMSVFSHGKPVIVAKLNPDIMETGVIERPKPTPQQLRQMMRQAQQAARQPQTPQARNARMRPLQVGSFGEPQ